MATDDAQLRLVKLFYQIAFLDSRRRAGLALSPDDEDRLAVLVSALGGDPGWRRRRFRRRPMLLRAVAKSANGVARATILNMAPDGMQVAAEIEVEAGESVLIKIGRPGTTQYSFPCKVVRAEQRDGATLLALTLSGIPLELRYGSRDEEEPLPQRLPALVRQTG